MDLRRYWFAIKNKFTGSSREAEAPKVPAVMLRCDGLALPYCTVPAFEVREGEFVHLASLPPDMKEWERLRDLLSGHKPDPRVRLAAPVAVAGLPDGPYKMTCGQVVKRRLGLSRDDAAAFHRLIKAEPSLRLNQLGLNPRSLMGVAAALNEARIVLYHAYGTGGSAWVRQYVLAHIGSRAVIEVGWARQDPKLVYSGPGLIRLEWTENAHFPGWS